VRTILSQNTTDTLSRRAFDSLKERFPTYRAVLDAPTRDVEVRGVMGGGGGRAAAG
jgi:endonuclease III